MSKFKAGDRVRHRNDRSRTVTILATHEGHYWVRYDGDEWPCTAATAEFDRYHEPTPESFLTYGGKFKSGDRVRFTHDDSGAATVLAVHGGHIWMQHDGDEWPFTETVVDVDHFYELVPEPKEILL